MSSASLSLDEENYLVETPKEYSKAKVPYRVIVNSRDKVKYLYKMKSDLEKDISKLKEELDEAYRDNGLKMI